MKTNTLITLALACALPLGLGGCFIDEGADESAAAVIMDFPPTAGFSPFSDDATISTRLGTTETLVRITEDGTPTGWLASDWEQTSPRSVSFTLHSGVTFHDGEAMDADAVVHALNAALNSPNRPKGLGKAGLTAEATDSHTVTVTSDQDDPILPQRFADPGTMILSPAAYDSEEGHVDPIGHGTGPYVLGPVEGNTTTLAANENYWGKKPQVKEVKVSFNADGTARVNTFRGGSSDIIKGIPVASIPEIDSDAEVYNITLPRTTLLYLNTTAGLFTREDVRATAIAALSTDTIIDSIYEGFASDPHNSLFGGENSWAKNTSSLDLPDPRSKAELAEGPHTISLATWNDRPELPEAAEVIADQLRAAGFDVELTVADFASIEDRVISGRFDMVLGSRNFMIGAADPLTTLQSDYTCDGGYNISRLCDPTIDQAISAALSISDPDERLAAAGDIAGRIVATGAVVPIVADQAHLGARGYDGLAQDPMEIRLITEDLAKK